MFAQPGPLSKLPLQLATATTVFALLGAQSAAGQAAVNQKDPAPAETESESESESEDHRISEPSEDLPISRGVVLVGPLNFIFGAYGAEAIFRLNDGVGLRLRGFYNIYEARVADVQAWDMLTGVQLHPGGRLFQNWYLTANVGVSLVTAEGEDSAGSAISSSTTLLATMLGGGYQLDWQPFTARVGLGGGYWFGKKLRDLRSVEGVRHTRGVLIAIDGGMGISWQ